MNAPARKPTNLSIDSDLLEEARQLNINLSRAAENGLSIAVLQAKAEKWKMENAEALKSSNAYVDKHGLPLDEYRQF
jgi:antitoxin CcdA